MRSFSIARHVVFYVENDDGGITVLRVLHPNMDVASAFSDDDS